MTFFFETEEPITKKQINNLEKRLNFNFPKNYTEHLLKYNGGRCEPNIFNFNEGGNQTKSSIDWFLALHDGEYDNLEEYFKIYKVEEKRLPDSFFPIAHDDGGNLICMDNTTDKIYFWDHNIEVNYNLHSDLERSNLYFLADNLSQFLENLSEDL
ncbi:SMI1/KNR4 family protein [Kordia jejudonensis]|uniref:SMI1/KNR4 family protein n=1 Tax=Kordia jejudonensis TaxID=1348245 RepID=UPI00069B3D91|nr:SMI1/KNR4 family protein [Kordia jejudonensis]